MKKIALKKRFNPVNAATLTATAVAASMASLPVLAQGGASLRLEEVLVTATKTEELASDVAISANIVTSDDLDKIGASDFTEVAKLAPGLDFAATRDPVSGAIKLRNVGSDSFEGGSDKAVAVFIDGFVQAQPNSVFTTLYDVDRVEVLRGPQGTLYGKNAPAGVISIKTRRPDFSGVNGYVEGSLSNYDTYKTEGAINVPLTDKVAMRVSGVTTESDGYFYNPLLNVDSGAYNRKDGRIKLLFVPTDNLVVTFAYKNANLESNLAKNLYDGEVPNSGGLGPNGGAIISDPEDYLTYGEDPMMSDADIEDTMLTIEWQVANYTVTSLTSYSELDFDIQGGNNAIPEDDTILTNGSTTRQVTEELRIGNDGFGDVEWLAGIFYSHFTRRGATQLPPLEFGGEDIGETWGYFGNAAYYIGDKWKVSLGLRYNDEKKATDTTPAVGAPFTRSENFYQTSYSFKLHYNMTSDVMFYVAADSAYRSGGFNNFALGVAGAGYVGSIPGALEFTDRFGTFDAEESTAFEVGMKGSFMDGRAQANVAIFHQVFDDYQLNQTPENGEEWAAVGSALDTFVPSAIVPVDELITQGIEADGRMLFTEHWSGSAKVSYAHAVADEFSNRLCAFGEAPQGQIYCPMDGTRLNDDPLWNANFQVAYENSWEDFNYAARLIANYKSAPTYDNGAGSNADWDEYNSDYATLDFNVTLSPLTEAWSTRLWVKNLTDEARPASEGALDEGVPSQSTMRYNTFIPPRTYGITATYNF